MIGSCCNTDTDPRADTSDRRLTYTPGSYWVIVEVGEYSNTTNSDASFFDCSDLVVRSKDEDEALAKQRHAIEMRKRDLSYLYHPGSSFRLHFVVQPPPRVIFQPCWSAKRWRSIT